jgi:hypothetical protein
MRRQHGPGYRDGRNEEHQRGRVPRWREIDRASSRATRGDCFEHGLVRSLLGGSYDYRSYLHDDPCSRCRLVSLVPALWWRHRRRATDLRRTQGDWPLKRAPSPDEGAPAGALLDALAAPLPNTDLWLGKDGVAETVAKAMGVDAKTARKNVVASIGGFATGRFTTPEEVRTLVTVLASERTANVTGSQYVIDGGLIKTT